MLRSFLFICIILNVQSILVGASASVLPVLNNSSTNAFLPNKEVFYLSGFWSRQFSYSEAVSAASFIHAASV